MGSRDGHIIDSRKITFPAYNKIIYSQNIQIIEITFKVYLLNVVH